MKPLLATLLGALSLAQACGTEVIPPVTDRPQLKVTPPPMIQGNKIAQPPAEGLKLTLKEAEADALKNHPQILTAKLTAEAVQQQIREARSGFFPQIYGEVDAVYAPEGTRLAALNGLNNPSIYSRQSDGVMINQLITDFGRTFDLTQSARSSADAASDRLNAVKAMIVLTVDRTYFDLRKAQAVLEVSPRCSKSASV